MTIKLKTLDDLKTLYNSNEYYLDVIDALDNNRDLFELHAYIYRKASTFNPVYHTLEFSNIPAVDRKKLNLDMITSGANAEGMDCLEIGYRSIAYEAKCYDEQNIDKGLAHKEVANKKTPIDTTNIDQLIFITNKRKASYKAEKYNPKVGYIFREEIYSKDTIDVVREYLGNQKQKTYNPFNPRDEFFEETIIDCGEQINNLPSKRLITFDDRIKLFMHWPTSTGKGSMPRMIYDRYIKPLWSGKGQPINCIVNPGLTVLKTNMLKQIEHDLALGNNVRHLALCPITSGLNLVELQTVKHLADVVTSDMQLYDLLNEYKDCEIWLHVTNDSYHKMAGMLKALKKSIFFSHIDEVHHNIQPDDSAWGAPLNNKILNVKFAFMTSANLRIATGTGAQQYTMEDYEFADIHLLELSEGRAVELGYKRQIRQLVYEYDLDAYPHDWQITLDEGDLPIVKIGNTTVPLHWAEQLDANIRAYVEHEIKFMKYTFNRVENIVAFSKIYQPLKEDILLDMTRSGVLSSNSKMYRDILKRTFTVADTHSNSTTKIVRAVEALPDIYSDGADFGHCYLFGEGWDPKDGWVEAGCFMDPTHSEIRVYQDTSRQARGPEHRKYGELVQAVHKERGEEDIEYRNRLCKTVMDVSEKIQNGQDDIRDHVIFKSVRKIRNKTKGTREQGVDFETHFDEVGADVLAGAFSGYVEFGKHYGLSVKHQEIVDFYQSECEKRDCRYFRLSYKTEQNKILHETENKFPEFTNNIIRCIIRGSLCYMNASLKVQIFDWKRDNKKVSEERKQICRKVMLNCVKNSFAPSSGHFWYLEKFKQFAFIKKYLDLGMYFSPSLIGTGTDKSLYDFFPSDIYVENQQKVKQAVIAFYQNKIDNQQFNKSKGELNSVGNKEENVYISRRGNELTRRGNKLQSFVFKQTGIKVNREILTQISRCNQIVGGVTFTYSQKEKETILRFDMLRKEYVAIQDTFPKVNKCIDILISTGNQFDDTLFWRRNASKKSGLAITSVHNLFRNNNSNWFNSIIDTHPKKEQIFKIAKKITFDAKSKAMAAAHSINKIRFFTGVCKKTGIVVSGTYEELEAKGFNIGRINRVIDHPISNKTHKGYIWTKEEQDA